MDGRLEIIEPGDVFRCRCGRVKDGATRGPKGGKQWAWRLTDGTRLCAKQCPAADDVSAQQAMDDARGEWEEAEGERLYG